MCPDGHFISVSITGPINRYSTSRGDYADQEVYYETYDPTGLYSIDVSQYGSFIDLLEAGSIGLDLSSPQLSIKSVGQKTDFSFQISMNGL